VLGRDQRVLDENLAKGRVAVTTGFTDDCLLPFVKAGLPIKPVPSLKEGTYRATAERLYKGFGPNDRRLDSDTKWLRKTGVTSAKGQLSVKDFWQIEN